MPHCGPTNAIPSCPASPTVGFGSDCYGFGSRLGYGGVGTGFGGTTSAASLGVLEGRRPHCIVQVPSSEVTIQPPPFVVTMPGPILSATPSPLEVGGYTPCAAPDSGRGFGSGNHGLRYSDLNSRGFLGRHDIFGLNSCYDVCN